MKPRYLQVVVEVPAEVSVADAKQYIEEELAAAGGSRHPDDSLFHGLRVKSIRSVKL